MVPDYPIRQKASNLVRYSCMTFGLANLIGAIVYSESQNMAALVGGALVGSVWFAFGYYGGLPLFDTVRDWHSPVVAGVIEKTHRQGLLVMRRRKWVSWLSIPGMPIAMLFLIPLLKNIGHPELVLFLVGVPVIFIQFRYYLSRCPRCGLGFFALSSSRTAFLRRGNACSHCGLSLDDYKTH